MLLDFTFLTFFESALFGLFTSSTWIASFGSSKAGIFFQNCFYIHINYFKSRSFCFCVSCCHCIILNHKLREVSILCMCCIPSSQKWNNIIYGFSRWYLNFWTVMVAGKFIDHFFHQFAHLTPGALQLQLHRIFQLILHRNTRTCHEP